jgi:preprotein translocase subunit SecE
MATQAAKMNEETQGGAASQLPQRVAGTIQNTKTFLEETRVEMKKVTWPTREDVIATTGVVLATVAFFAVYLYFVEQGAARAVGYLLKRFGA